MMFPVIKTIDDVLPAIVGRKEFAVKEGGEYTSIDYNYVVGPETFDCPIRRECRGIKFDKSGAILARPFHKFFNLGEREPAESVDFSQPHEITEAFDGSMIHPALLDGKTLVFMTRAGLTDQAAAAWADFSTADNYLKFMLGCLENNLTPLFEYTSPSNRIVIKYDKPMLTLLAIRYNQTGIYFSPSSVRRVATLAHIPYAGLPSPQKVEDLSTFSKYVEKLEGKEGFVIHFDTGHLIKVKTKQYVEIHRQLSAMRSKKDMVRLVLSDNYDDIVGRFHPADKEVLVTFACGVWDKLIEEGDILDTLVKGAKDKSRKDFALEVIPTLPKHLQAAAFTVYSGEDGWEAMRVTYLRWPELMDVEWVGFSSPVS